MLLPAALAGLAILAALIWAVCGRLAITREFRAEFLQDKPGGQWSLEWGRVPRRPGEKATGNGAWLDLNSRITSETLEVIPSGAATISGRSFHLWLYEVRPLAHTKKGRAEAADIKGYLTTAPAGSLLGRWIDFDQGEGIVYNDSSPGLLRMTLPPGGVTLDLAKTEDGGLVTFRYGGEEQTIDLSGAVQQKLVVRLERTRTPAHTSLEIGQRLPGYPMQGFTLRARGLLPGTVATLRDGAIEARVFGRVVLRQPIGVAPGSASSPGSAGGSSSGVTIRAAEAGDTTHSLPIPSGIPLAGHAFGYAVVFLTLCGLSAVGWLVVAAVRAGPPRWLTFDAASLLAVILVRVWMAWWSPFCYCPDSVDYVVGAKRFVETGSLDHFAGPRVPGYAVFLAPMWRYFEDFNAAMIAAQAFVGVLTAILCRAVAARFMPKPWPTIALLGAGLSPVLIAWEHFAMSESLGAFLIVFVCWAVLRPGAWSKRNGLVGCLIYAALIGVACAGSALVRGNLQLLLIVVPVLVAALAWKEFGPVRSLAFAAALVIAGSACLMPRVLRNKSEYGQPALILGGGWMRGLLTFRNGTLDENQAAAFDARIAVEIRDLRESERLGDYEFAERYVAKSSTIPIPPGTHRGSVEDRKMEFLARESYARRPDRRVGAAIEAFLNVLGVWTFLDTDGFHENEFFTRPARGVMIRSETNFWVGADYWPGSAEVKELCERAEHDITHLEGTANAIIFDRFFRADLAFRPVWGVFLIIGVFAALWRRDVPMLCIAALVGGNAFALAWVVQCGIDRYGVPMEPLLRLVALYGLWRTIEWVKLSRRPDAGPEALRRPGFF